MLRQLDGGDGDAAGAEARGRFFGRRVNCEQVPLLPAWAVAQFFDDLQETPHLLVWKDSTGTVREAVYITPHDNDVPITANELRIWAERDAETGEVEIQRNDGTTDIIRTLLRPLPRNGGRVRLLICPDCLTPRRGFPPKKEAEDDYQAAAPNESRTPNWH